MRGIFSVYELEAFLSVIFSVILNQRGILNARDLADLLHKEGIVILAEDFHSHFGLFFS